MASPASIAGMLRPARGTSGPSIPRGGRMLRAARNSGNHNGHRTGHRAIAGTAPAFKGGYGSQARLAIARDENGWTRRRSSTAASREGTTLATRPSRWSPASTPMQRRLLQLPPTPVEQRDRARLQWRPHQRPPVPYSRMVAAWSRSGSFSPSADAGQHCASQAEAAASAARHRG